MAFKPLQLPSGSWRSGYFDPITRRQVRRTFATPGEAREWAAAAEEEARREALLRRGLDDEAAVLVAQAQDLMRSTALLAAFALDAGDTERATRLAADVVRLHERAALMLAADDGEV